MTMPMYPDWPQMYLDAAHPDGITPEPGDRLFRVSAEASMALCPARQEVRTVTNEKMFFGTVCHAMIEQRPDGLWTPEEIEVLADGLLAEERPEDTIRGLMGGDTDDWFAELDGMHRAWRWWWESQTEVEIIRQEGSLIAPLDGGVWLGGTPDAIGRHIPTGQTLGLDWKTSGSMWQQGKADGTRQDDLYAYLAQRVHGERIDGWWFVIGDRSKGVWKALPTAVTADSVLSAVTVVGRMAAYLDSGLPLVHTPFDGFGKRGWHCKPDYCENWNRCGGRFLGDEWDGAVRAEGMWR